MKKSLAILAVAALLAVSCQKEENSASFPFLPELNENVVLRTEEDANILVSYFDTSYQDALPNPLCGFSDSTFNSTTHTYTLTFNGASCDGDIQRSGVISAQLITGLIWNDLGAQIKVTFQNYQIQFAGTGQNVIINGERTFTNESGNQTLNDLQIGVGEVKVTCFGNISVDLNVE